MKLKCWTRKTKKNKKYVTCSSTYNKAPVVFPVGNYGPAGPPPPPAQMRMPGAKKPIKPYTPDINVIKPYMR